MDIRVVEDVGSLRDAWMKLLQESETGTVFQGPSFLEVWWGEFKSDSAQRVILSAYEGNELLGVGAFEVEKNLVRFLGMRKVLGGEEMTDYGDIVVKRGIEEGVWREFISYIRNHISDSELVFDYVREESPSFGILPTLADELGLRMQREKQEVAPVVRLPDSWERYVTGFPRKKRHELKRKVRRFEEEYVAKLTVLDKVSAPDVDTFVALVRASSDEKRTFMNEHMAKFFVTLIQRSVAENLGALAFLETNERQLGGIFLLKDGKKLLGYNGGSPEVQGQAVGVVMTAKLIEWAIEHEFTEFDFLRGGERYKYDLGAQDRQLWQIGLKR